MLSKDRGSSVDETEIKDVSEYFYEDKNLFDFSDYSGDSKFFNAVNKKVISKMKDELKEI